jgi:hypothetical protein
VLDDQPMDPATRNRTPVNLPHTQMILIHHDTAREERDRAIHQPERLLDDAKGSARVMAPMLHPPSWGRRTAPADCAR